MGYKNPDQDQLAVEISELSFDSTYPEYNEETFKIHDWSKFYGDIKEAIPANIPISLGKEVIMHYFVDTDHTGDQLTRMSRTGFIVLL